jgi:uncharacterized membrane protein
LGANTTSAVRPGTWFIPVAAFPSSLAYSPVCYLPQAVGIALGRLFDLPPVALLYLGRLMAVVCTVFLGYAALAATRFFRWPLLLLLLMPMTLFQAASLSADAVTNALSIVFFGSLLGQMEQNRDLGVPHNLRAAWVLCTF